MTLETFIRQNLSRWRRAELLCDAAPLRTAPDEVAEAYEALTADLVYAQTHYPAEVLTQYLNDLALALQLKLNRRAPSRWRDVGRFVVHDVPEAVYACRRYLLASFVTFLIGVAIGVISQLADPDFARLILGDGYVDMTLDNIAKGTPMAVYDGGGRTDMFLSITFNNVGVALSTFAGGLLTLFGTGAMLLSNAVMLGSFQTFFFQHGAGWASVPAVWLHGTLEISAIIMAGGSGLALGTGWLFPGNLSRGEAFRRSARMALRVVAGLVPVFVVAAFIEGFFTRHTEWPLALRLTIIGLSLIFIILYFIVWPRHVARRGVSPRNALRSASPSGSRHNPLAYDQV